MSGSVEFPRAGHNRKACDLHLRQAGSAEEPGGRCDGQPHDSKVTRRVEITGGIIAHQVGRREIGQAAGPAVNPSPGSISATVVRDLEDVPRLRRGIEVITRLRDPGVVRICRIDVDAAHKTGRIRRRTR